MSTTGASWPRSPGIVRGIALAVLLPLAITSLSYIEWRISDALGYIGPFDRAQFGWGVVVPTWLAAGAVAAFRWSRLSTSQARWAAFAMTAVIATIGGWLLWQAAIEADAACQFGAADSPLVRGFQFLGVGVLIGLDPAVAGLAGRRAARGSVVRMIVVAAAVGFAFVWVAVLGSYAIAGGMSCNRPTPGL